MDYRELTDNNKQEIVREILRDKESHHYQLTLHLEMAVAAPDPSVPPDQIRAQIGNVEAAINVLQSKLSGTES